MELWQVRKRFKPLRSRVRRLRRRSLAVQQAEEQVIVALCLGERLETELSVLHFTQRCAEARLKRMRLWLEGASMMMKSPSPLVAPEHREAVERLEVRLSAVGAHDAAATARQLLSELQSLTARLDDVRLRAGRVTQLALEHLEQLERSLQAGGLAQSA
jgi:hypothetical protein